MSAVGTSTIETLDPEADIPDGGTIGWTRPASDEAVKAVLAADPASPDGRSEWLWVRLANGDLLLGVFPQGDTYFEHEAEHSAPDGTVPA